MNSTDYSYDDISENSAVLEKPPENMGSFYLRKTGEIRNVYEIFIISECPVHIINLMIIFILPYFLFADRVLLHKNLKLIIISYLFAAFFLSLSRLSWLICELFWVPTNIMEIFMYLRFVFSSSVGAHLCVFSAERITATIRSKRYEEKSCYLLIICFCFLTYPYSLLLLYSKYNFKHGRELNVFMTILVSTVALSAIIVNYFVNKKRVRARRFKAQISEAYQMRENIRTSRLLLRIYLASVVFLGLSCFFLLRFSSTLTDPKKEWDTITFGFLYDIIVAIGSTVGTIILGQHVVPNEFFKSLLMATNFDKCIPKHNGVAPTEQQPTTFKSVHGGNVEIGNQSPDEEARVYFTQLSKAWG